MNIEKIKAKLKKEIPGLTGAEIDGMVSMLPYNLPQVFADTAVKVLVMIHKNPELLSKLPLVKEEPQDAARVLQYDPRELPKVCKNSNQNEIGQFATSELTLELGKCSTDYNQNDIAEDGTCVYGEE